MPQSDNLKEVRQAGPCTMVIFGASGDLTHRKLLPALYNLSTEGLLPDSFAVLGTARGEMSDDAFRSDLSNAMHGDVDRERLRDLLKRVTYHQADLTKEGHADTLRERVAAVDEEHGTEGNVLFYLATPPELVRADRAPSWRERVDRRNERWRGAGWWSRSRSATTSRPPASSTRSWPRC